MNKGNRNYIELNKKPHTY